MSDNDDDEPLRLPAKVAATRSYAQDSLAPFQRLPLPEELPSPEQASSRPLVLGALLGLILFCVVVIGGVLLMAFVR